MRKQRSDLQQILKRNDQKEVKDNQKINASDDPIKRFHNKHGQVDSPPKRSSWKKLNITGVPS